MRDERRGGAWVWVVLVLALLALGIFLAPGFLASSRASNERTDYSSLKTLASAEADFRGNDRDGNREQDFWVGDVAGLYFLKPEMSEERIKLIEVGVAGADDAPRAEHAAARKAEAVAAAPKRGYHFRALTFYEDGSGKKIAYDAGNGRNPTRFGFIATPAGDDPSKTDTFIVNEGNTIFRKRLDGKRIDTFPRDPLGAGWRKLD